MINEFFLELVEIEDIKKLDLYSNMIDISIKDDESFLLSNGIISHNSASGSLKQARNSETDGVYALKGKVKNTKRLGDLADNKELLEIMSILGIEPHKQLKCEYQRIIISADSDCIDGEHEVITIDGPKKIKDLTYYDKILTHTNTYKEIEEIIESKKDKYIEIELNGEKFIFSEFHKLIIFRNGEIQEIFAKDIKKTDFLLTKR